jgi:tetratricopeptide (TPR) repeat protein
METLKRSLALAAQQLQRNDVKGALASLQPLLDPTIEPTTRLEALRIVSLARLLAGDVKGARAAMDDAVETARALSPGHKGRALERRALILQNLGEIAAARNDLDAAAASFKETGEVALRAQMEDRSGQLAAAVGDLETAAACHLTAAALASGALDVKGDRRAAPPKNPGEPAPDAAAEAQYLVHAGAALHLGAKPELARAALERALSLLAGETPLRAQALHNLGVVLSDLGEHDAALAQLEAALAADLARKAEKDAIATRLRIAFAARRKGDVARARNEAKKARADADGTKDPALVVEALLELSSVELAARATEAALQAARDAVSVSQGHPRLLARTTLHSASCARAVGKKDTARAGFKMAQEIAEAAGEPVIAAAAAKELASLG